MTRKIQFLLAVTLVLGLAALSGWSTEKTTKASVLGQEQETASGNVMKATSNDDKLSVSVTEVKLKEQRDDIIAILIGFRVKAPSAVKVVKFNVEIELTDATGRKAKGQRIIVISENDPLPESTVVEVRVPSAFERITDGTSNTFKAVVSASARSSALGDGSVRSATGRKEGRLVKQP